MQLVNFSSYDGDCLHGAPPRSETEVSEPTISLVMELAVIVGPSEELVCLEGFCREHPKVASDFRCPLIFMSMAADALHDKNYEQARKFLRAMYFIESYALEDEDFLTALHSLGNSAEVDDRCPNSLKHMIAGFNHSKSIKGVHEEISSRTDCRCFHL